MAPDFFTTHLSSSPIIAILRGLTPEQSIAVANQCWDAGIHLVEIPIQSLEAVASLRAVAAHTDDSARLLGAGTIVCSADVDRAHEAGATFLVSPGLFPAAVARAKELSLPILPGVLSPTEIQAALDLGLHTQKIFPADALSPSAIRTLRGPFPGVHFVAVGGVTPENAQEFLAAGTIGLGIGSALSEPSALARFAALKPALGAAPVTHSITEEGYEPHDKP